MDPLKITPPFSYSYQCGSTLLVSYIPVYMYWVSLQMVSILLALGVTSSPLPNEWLKQWTPPVSWPLHLMESVVKNSFPHSSSIHSLQLIMPHQIVSTFVNNITLLFSFGLCCPALACYIMFSTCLTLWGWLMLTGRFVSFCLEGPPSRSVSSQCLTEQNPISAHENAIQTPKIDDDNDSDNPRGSIATQQLICNEYLSLLNHQLHDVNSSLTVCKWPIISTSFLFVTLLSWEMVGDEVGWKGGLWVPATGVLLFFALWIWDYLLTLDSLSLGNHCSHFSFLFTFPPEAKIPSPPEATHSLELTHSSLHLTPPPPPPIPVQNHSRNT